MERIAELRQERGWSQVKLGAVADVNPSTVNQIERGMRHPNSSTLEKLAGALEVEVAELFRRAEAPKARAPLSEEDKRRGIRQQLRNHFYGRGRNYEATRREVEKYSRRWEQKLDKGSFSREALAEWFAIAAVLRPLIDESFSAELRDLVAEHGQEPDLVEKYSVLRPAVERWGSLCLRVMSEGERRFDDVVLEDISVEDRAEMKFWAEEIHASAS